jgi:hypothetical protein
LKLREEEVPLVEEGIPLEEEREEEIGYGRGVWF